MLCGCGAKRISKARISKQKVRCGAGAVAVRVLSKVDKQRLGAWLGAVLGVKQGCGSIQAKIRWFGVWCGGC